MQASSETHDGLNTAVAEVISLESRLLDASVRRSSQEVLALLHPEFTEFGASGRRWSAVDVAASMAAAAEQGERVEGRNFTGNRLADEVILLTYGAQPRPRVPSQFCVDPLP